MSDIISRVENFLKNYNLIPQKKKFLVGFSGGVDSLCLLDILNNLGLDVVAIHLNHNWRGDESLKDENFCEDFCKKNNIEFYSETLSDNIPKTETAARNARYEFFSRCAEKFGTDVVMTAHNADDNAETLFYRIVKGTGVSGLEGIREKRGIFFRPLLKISRAEIDDYDLEKNLAPNIDSSNFNTKYKRNFIRHEIFPMCDKINPKFKDAINSLSELAKDDLELLDEYMNIIKNDIKNSAKNFKTCSKVVQNRIVRNIFIENNIDYDKKSIEKIRDFIIKNSTSKSGKICSFANNLFIFVNEEKFEVIKKEETHYNEVKIYNVGEYNFGDYKFVIEKASSTLDRYPEDSEFTAYVELDKIDFILRNRKDGDIISPLGLDGTQKLKKYLNAKSIPQYKKDKLVFLCQNNEVLWAPGIGLSNKIKVKNKATHILKLIKR